MAKLILAMATSIMATKRKRRAAGAVVRGRAGAVEEVEAEFAIMLPSELPPAERYRPLEKQLIPWELYYSFGLVMSQLKWLIS